MEDYYNFFRMLRKCKIDNRQLTKDFGRRAAFVLNYKCPVVVKRGGIPLDVMAADCNFSSDEELFECIMNYKSKYKFLQEEQDYYERYNDKMS